MKNKTKQIKSNLRARKDAWKEYCDAQPPFADPGSEIMFIHGWEAGAEWAMQVINEITRKK